MRRFAKALVIPALFLFTIVLLTSCFGKPPEALSTDKLLKIARNYLEQGRGGVAYNYFIEVLDRDPDNIQALYGIVLATDLRVFSFLDGIIDLVSGVDVYQPSLKECQDACERLGECDLYYAAWTDAESCLQDCPFKLQKFMFKTMIDGSTCERILDVGLEWIVPTSQENCEILCKDLQHCGLIHPPMTDTLAECIDRCPRSYVQRHSKCYMKHIGECNGYDRTCFEHITVGLQVLFRDIGLTIPPQIIKYSDKILTLPDIYQYHLSHFKWKLRQPPVSITFTDDFLPGRYAQGFLYLSRALAHFFQAFNLLATSVMLEMNFPALDLHFTYPHLQGVEDYLYAITDLITVWLYDPIFPFAFQVKNDAYAAPQIVEGGLEIGRMFGSYADMFNYILNDHDRQQGKALGYNDDNMNFNWDRDETMTITITINYKDTDLNITRDQAVVLMDVCRALEANFLDRIPFDVSKVTDVLEAFGLGDFAFIGDLLAAWFPDGVVDLSEPFNHFGRDDFRILLQTLVDKLQIIMDLLKDSQA